MNAVEEKSVLQISKTHPFEIPVDHSLIVHIGQSPRDVA